jgi:hypothetical protein
MKSLVFFQGKQEENVKLLQQYADTESAQQGKSESPATLKVSLFRGFHVVFFEKFFIEKCYFLAILLLFSKN